MKIYTKTGDDGTTSLFDGTRVSKTDPRVEAYGHVDETNALLGMALAVLDHREQDIFALVGQIQKDLFALGAQLANPAKRKQKQKADFSADKVTFLEKNIDRLEEELSPMKNFILPTGVTASATLHLARTVCRRAERFVVGLGKPVDPILVTYLNRLSDFLFVLARVVNMRAGVSDIPWD